MAETQREVARKHAEAPLVLAIDIGSSATRGRIYDGRAIPVKKLAERRRHQFTIEPDGTVVADADQLCAEVVAVIDALLEGAGKHAHGIVAVAMDTFASTIVGVDTQGHAVSPVYTYADSRPADCIDELRQRLDEDAAQQRTGVRFHASYLPARVLWLARENPEALQRAAYWMSLGEFIFFRLLGQRAASYASASWAGIVNRHTLDYDDELLAALPIKAEQLGPLHDTADPLRGLAPGFAERWPALRAARWFPAIADGYASNLGCDARGSATAALAIGSSAAMRALLPAQPAVVPRGLWCYTVDRTHALLGGALNDGGRALDWLRTLLQLPDAATLDRVAHAAPERTTPTVLPFLTGERNPGYAPHAMASFSGMDWQTAPAAIFRGTLEGVALRLALIADELRGEAPAVARLIASGGGIETVPGWTGILADILGLPVTTSAEGQATLRGTALLALEIVAPDHARAHAAIGETANPDAANGPLYLEKRRTHADAYAALVAASAATPLASQSKTPPAAP
jgi:gluconokinase